MRIKLSMMFIAISMTALLCGVMFMTPLIVAGAFALLTMTITPAIWLTGTIFARGPWQAFFIGGMFTGFFPHIFCLYYLYVTTVSLISDGFGDGLNLGVSESSELLTARLALAGIWVAPGIFSFAGGIASFFTHRLVRRRNSDEDIFPSQDLMEPI